MACMTGAEEDAYAATNYAANLDAAEPAKQKSLPIKFHTLAGLKRIDLDDDEADDETYRAFQLARYTGEANMLIKQHEEEFMRKRKREREERELGDSRGNVAQSSQQAYQPRANQALNNEQQQPPLPQQQPRRKNRMAEIMGDNMEEEVLVQIGEGAESTQLPFDAVHVSKSGDIEDGDQHFVMTDQLRHKELKNAVTESSEQDSESEAQALAKKMQFEQQKVMEFNARQAAKDRKDVKAMEDERELGEAMHAHHLTFDDKGRVIPDF